MIGLLYDPAYKLNYYVAQLNVDLDPLAERLIVMDRLSSNVFYNGNADITKFNLNVKYATSSEIIVLMIDDTREYNLKGVDGVQLQLVDLVATP